MIKRTITAVFILAAVFSACTPEISTLPMGVSLEFSSMTLAPGESLQLTAHIMPDDATIKTLKWESSDPNVATVIDGVVTGVAEGRTNITVTTNSGKKSDVCVLTVEYPVYSVTIDQTMTVLTVGKTQRLTANVFPAHAPDRSVKWESSNPEIATISEEGMVTAISAGVATITVITDVGSRVATSIVRVISDRHIIMNTSYGMGTLYFFVSGNGIIQVNWGDDSESESFLISSSPRNISHYYTAQSSYAITIEGEDITTFTISGFQFYLTSLELNGMNSLTQLNCSNNQLTSINISANTELMDLNCSYNQLADINLSANTGLTHLNCSNNHLMGIDLSANTQLTDLNCSYNQLTDIDLSANTQLKRLNFDNNSWLTSLNVSNTKIESFNVSDCLSLQYLIVRDNAELTELNCSNNRIMSLDASDNIALASLNCSSNRLSDLVIRNNPTLASLDCSGNLLTNLYVSDNPALIYLKCGSNQLTNLDISNNPALNSLDCSGNQLTGLDMSANFMLTLLDCQFNQLPTEALNDLFVTLHGNDVGENKTVYILGNPGTFDCEPTIATNKGWEVVLGNYMTMTMQPYGSTSINISGTGAMTIDWGDGSVENYSLQSFWNTYFHQYSFYNNHLTVTIVGEITGLNVSGLSLTSLDLGNNSALTELFCAYNQLTSLDLSNNTALTNLDCSGNQLTNLDLSNNTVLFNLTCSYNQLTSLDLRNNPILNMIFCSNNQLTSLNLGNQFDLVSLGCQSNQLSVTGLNALFRTLHGNWLNGGYKWIFIGGNPGSSDCDRSIAIGKGWTVQEW